MSLNLILALIAGLFWFGAFFWYFRGDMVNAGLKGFAARLPWRRKATPEEEQARQ